MGPRNIKASSTRIASRRGGLLSAVVLTALVVSAAPASAAGAGAVDPTFGGGGLATVAVGTWAGANATVTDPSGRIVTVGEAQINGVTTMIATRMSADGGVDSSFGAGGAAVVNIGGSASGNAIALQPDGKILLAGTGAGSGQLDFAVARLLPNGSLDPTFGGGGVTTVPIGSYAIATGIAVQPDGKIVLGGMALVGQAQFAVARLNPNGTPDASFAGQGSTTFGPTGGAWGLALAPDGKIVLAGESYGTPDHPFMAARVLPSGALDPSFGASGIVSVPVGTKAFGDAVALQPDGKIVVAGSAFTSTGVAATIRLLPGGSLDPSFGAAGISLVPDSNGVNAMALDPAGRIVLGLLGAGAIRLNPDGSADQSFGSGGIATAQFGTQDAANGVMVTASGAIVLSGVATINGRAVVSVIRLVGGPPPAPPSPILPVIGGVPTTVNQTVTQLLPPPPSISRAGVIGKTLPATRPFAVLSHASLAARSFKAARGTMLGVTVSEPATVTIRVARGSKRPLRLTFRAVAGRNRYLLRVPSLRPGAYRAAITALDAAGTPSRVLALAFVIKR